MDADVDVVRLNPDLVAAFRDLDFTDHDATLLALNNACVAVVRYRLEDCHMTHAEAVAIYSLKEEPALQIDLVTVCAAGSFVILLLAALHAITL